jgi:hypothetical protein
VKTNKFFPLALAYLIVTFAIAASWHLAIFKSTYEELAIFTRKEPLIPLGLTSMALQAIVVAYLYPLFAGGKSGLMTGLRFGLIMGVFIGSSAVFAEAGKQVVTSLTTWLILESIYYLVQFAIVGMVLALVYGKGASAGP